MELYTLSSTFQRDVYLENFTSLVWTERYNSYGDFVLTYPLGSNLDAVVGVYTVLAIDESREAMIVENVSVEDNVVTASGRSLISLLMQRIFRTTISTTVDSVTMQSDTIPNLMTYIVYHMCVDVNAFGGGIFPAGTIANSQIINGLTVGSFPSPYGSDTVYGNIVLQFGVLYDAVVTLAQVDNTGFTMWYAGVGYGPASPVFLTYKGTDRTSRQSRVPVVAFSSLEDSLANIKSLTSIQDYKDNVIVLAKNMTDKTATGFAGPGTYGRTGTIGYNYDTSKTPTNIFQRTTLIVADDIDAQTFGSSAALQIALNQRALNELYNAMFVRTFDGQIVPQAPYTFGVDYKVGDIIELRAFGKAAVYARVTEYIRNQDKNGITGYPTLSAIF